MLCFFVRTCPQGHKWTPGKQSKVVESPGADPAWNGGFAYVTWRRLLSSCLAGPFSPHKNRSRAKHHCFLRVADSLEDDRSTMGHFAPHLLLLSVVFLFFVFAKGPNAGFSSAGSEGLNAVFFTHLVFPAHAAWLPTRRSSRMEPAVASPRLCSVPPFLRHSAYTCVPYELHLHQEP